MKHLPGQCSPFQKTESCSSCEGAPCLRTIYITLSLLDILHCIRLSLAQQKRGRPSSLMNCRAAEVNGRDCRGFGAGHTHFFVVSTLPPLRVRP